MINNTLILFGLGMLFLITMGVILILANRIFQIISEQIKNKNSSDVKIIKPESSIKRRSILQEWYSQEK